MNYKKNNGVKNKTFTTFSSRFTPFLYLLLLWLLLIPAITPLLQPTLTDSADVLLHLYRVVALQDAVAQGQLFPRWLPDLAYGYGFPLFVYYAPLSYYITLLFTGLGAINALNLSFILAMLLAGTGTFLFLKSRFGPLAGLVAGVAYGYAPFLLLNTLSRGSLPAAWALAAFPFVFWIFGLLITRSTQSDKFHLSILVPIAGLIFGIALLMHNVSSLLFGPFLALYLGTELVVQYFWRKHQPHLDTRLTTYLKLVVLPLAVAGLLGAGLAAFFLLPAMFEKDFAQVERVIITPDFDFRYNFVTIRQLLSLPQPANTGLLNPHYPFTLGVVQVALALVALAGSFRLKQVRQRSIVLFCGFGMLGVIFMMLPISLEVWEQLPLLAFVQHPHRLLGPASFMLATLAGISVVVLPKWLRLWFSVVAIVLLFLAAVPLLYPRYHNNLPAFPSQLDMMAYEHTGGAIGTTSFGEYLPVWVQQVPQESPLETMYQSGAPIERLDNAFLPPGAQILEATYGFNQADIRIDTPEPMQAVFHTFYFPGWQATVDGQPAPTAAVTERGLIGVTLPEGQHQVRLSFTETPLRTTANWLSVIAFAAIVALFVLYFVRHHKADDRDSAEEVTHTGKALAVLSGLALLLILAKFILFDYVDTPLKRTFDGTTVAGADVSTNMNFGHQANLLGYSLDSDGVEAGQSFALTPYWQARTLLNTDYSSLAQLVDGNKNLYAAQDNLHPGTFRSSRWQPWGFVQDPHSVPVPPGTPPGDYFLVTGLYDPATWTRLPVVEGGQPDWPDVVAVPVSVRKAARQPSVTELDIGWPVDEAFGKDLRLMGVTSERDSVIPGDFLRVAIFLGGAERTRPKLPDSPTAAWSGWQRGGRGN